MSGMSGKNALPAAMFLSHPGRSMPEREHTPPAARGGIVWPQRHIPPPGQALFTYSLSPAVILRDGLWPLSGH